MRGVVARRGARYITAWVDCVACPWERQCEGLNAGRAEGRTPTSFSCISTKYNLIAFFGSSEAQILNQFYIMEKKRKNEELQSRREFFKKAAKGALPILGAIVLASNPILSKATITHEGKEEMGCDFSCFGSCYGNCKGDCLGSCSGSCEGGCKGYCEGSCKSTCEGSCKSTCADSCYYTSK